MSYRIEGKDIVISGFEQGIADSPYQGIADMRNVDITSIPNEASVQYGMEEVVKPPVINAEPYTATDSTDTITVASTAGMYPYCAVFLESNTAGGLSNNVVYYAVNITATTFQLVLGVQRTVVNISSDGTGTFTTYQWSGVPTSYWVDTIGSMASVRGIFVADGPGRVWWFSQDQFSVNHTLPPRTLLFMGNTTLPTAGITGIVVWKGYLLVFTASFIFIMGINTGSGSFVASNGGPAAAWNYTWNAVFPNSHNGRINVLISGENQSLYWTSFTGLGAIREIAGQNFNPTNANTYTIDSDALSIPQYLSTCLTELGDYVLIGTSGPFVYTWDQQGLQFNSKINVPEPYINQIIAINQNAYIFAGNRGRIYITNGSGIDLYKKIPDYITGIQRPYFNILTVAGYRNFLYFGFVVRTNGNTIQNLAAGLWAIDLETDALIMLNKVSIAGYDAQVYMVAPMITSFGNIFNSGSPGAQVAIGYFQSASVNGISVSASNPYTNYESFIETDMIPVGTYLDPFTPSQVEWKTSAPLVQGEGIRILYRKNITEAWTPIWESNAIGQISDYHTADFEKAQWVQLRVELKSTNTNPSYVRLTEVRIRDFPS